MFHFPFIKVIVLYIIYNPILFDNDAI